MRCGGLNDISRERNRKISHKGHALPLPHATTHMHSHSHMPHTHAPPTHMHPPHIRTLPHMHPPTHTYTPTYAFLRTFVPLFGSNRNRHPTGCDLVLSTPDETWLSSFGSIFDSTEKPNPWSWMGRRRGRGQHLEKTHYV